MRTERIVTMQQAKRFEEYIPVDCAECEHYWTNRCDGSYEAAGRACTAYKAIRSIDIPREIERLRSEIKAIRTLFYIFWIWVFVVGMMLIFKF